MARSDSDDKKNTPSFYHSALEMKPLASDVVINSFINVNDAWVFTPFFRNTQFILRNDNIFYTNPTAHEAFLVVFILGAVAIGVQSIVRIFGIDRRKSVAEIIRAAGVEIETIEAVVSNPVEETETKDADSVEEKSLISKEKQSIVVLSEAYILDPDNNYKPSYVVLFSDTQYQRTMIAKRELELDETGNIKKLGATARSDYLRSLAQQWHEAKKAQALNLLQWTKNSLAKISFGSFLQFLFKISLWYWILWTISAGFFGFSATGIAFSLPLLAFVLPIALTLAEYVIRAIVDYNNRNNAANPELCQLVQNLLKHKISASSSAVPHAKTFADLKAWAEGEDAPPEAKAILKEKNWSQTIHSRTKTRIALNVTLSFFNFFVIASFIAWPLTDFLALQGIAASALGIASAASLIVLPIAISLAIGALFAVYTYKEAVKREQDFAKRLNSDAIIKAKEALDEIVLEVKLRRAYLKHLGGSARCPFSTDNSDFADYLSLKPRSRSAQIWSRIKKFFNRGNILANSLGTGTLLVRLFIGMVGALAQIGLVASFSYTSAAIIVPIVLMAVIWGGVNIVQFYQNRQLQKAEQNLASISTQLEIYQKENEWLKNQAALIEVTCAQAAPPAATAPIETAVVALAEAVIGDGVAQADAPVPASDNGEPAVFAPAPVPAAGCALPPSPVPTATPATVADEVEEGDGEGEGEGVSPLTRGPGTPG